MVGEARFARQSFLGANAQERLATCVVGIVGLGGGGSHIVQQLAHLGFKRYVIYDDDIVEDSNLNRLVGGTCVDEKAGSTKLFIARRTIFGLQPDAEVEAIACKWQTQPHALRRCHVVFGCVDSYQGRLELEVMARRYLINYIDIGMDVHGANPPRIGGQVILSSPGGLCMRCLGFITDEKLRREAGDYGNAGSHPQVVWSNGVLASTAVGVAVNLITDWTGVAKNYEYLVYDGNCGTVKPSITLRNRTDFECPHYSLNDVGTPVLTAL